MREFKLVVNRMKNHSSIVMNRVEDASVRRHMARIRRQIAVAQASGNCDVVAVSEAIDELAKVAEYMASGKYVVR